MCCTKKKGTIVTVTFPQGPFVVTAHSFRYYIVVSDGISRWQDTTETTCHIRQNVRAFTEEVPLHRVVLLLRISDAGWRLVTIFFSQWWRSPHPFSSNSMPWKHGKYQKHYSDHISIEIVSEGETHDISPCIGKWVPISSPAT